MDMTFSTFELSEFGWNDFFAAQLASEAPGALRPVRVMAVHRDRLVVAGPGIEAKVRPFSQDDGDGTTAATVGDWLLIEADTHRPRRLLKRRGVFQRLAAGTGRQAQLIAANVDTLFAVTSCNQDFSVARLERYVALAREADASPVVVLTKPDLADNAAELARQARLALADVPVELVDARARECVASLLAWCGPGQTVALAGSSGVGKSTLINTLTGHAHIATAGVRAHDGTGRHTTTGRAMHRLDRGGWLIDTPGMRELALTHVAAGLGEVFDDIAALAQACRFSNCAHETEPGCAVKAAVETGAIAADRVARWRKLAAEEAHNAATLGERRVQERSVGPLTKRIVSEKPSRRS
jgi:ribosome biogenesis GTPase